MSVKVTRLLVCDVPLCRSQVDIHAEDATTARAEAARERGWRHNTETNADLCRWHA